MNFSIDLLKQAIKWIEDFLPAIYSSGAATTISGLMGMYDGKPMLKTVTDALSCGVLTLTIAGLLSYLACLKMRSRSPGLSLALSAQKRSGTS